MTAYQFLPPLSEEDYEALKADIANRGVLVPIEYDQDGEVLDGHHRLRACKELGLTEWPTIYRQFETDAERRTHARQLNLARRHLAPEQRRQLIADELREAPQRSNRQIAAGLQVDHKTVQAVRAVMEETAEIPQLTRTVGADGKFRPASQRKPKAPKPSQHDADVMALARAWEMACVTAREQFLRSLGYEPHTASVADTIVAYADEEKPDATDLSDAEHQRSEPRERGAEGLRETEETGAAGRGHAGGKNGGGGDREGSEAPASEGIAGEGADAFGSLRDAREAVA